MTNLTTAHRAKGGRATRTRPRTVGVDELPTEPRDTLEGLQAWCAWAITAIATGQLDRNTANVMLKALSLQKVVTHALDVEKEVKTLKETVKRLQGAT
ncbi:MAG TPA: hypothetical protein VIV88_18675 [Gemmatimonadales bacterium]|jgi:hypothetical protein